MSLESTSSEEPTPRKSAVRKRQLVYTLNTNDVILGRGQHVKHEGNRQFVALVRSKVVEYNTSPEKSGKDMVARQIMHLIEALGGRFLRKAKSEEMSMESCSNSDANVWEIIDQAPVLVKIKQTFRDYSVKQRRAAAPTCEDVDTTGGAMLNLSFRDSDDTSTIHHPSGVTLLQTYFQADAVSAHVGDHGAFLRQALPSSLPYMTAPERSLRRPISHPSIVTTEKYNPPPPANPIPTEILRQAIGVWMQNEQLRQLENERTSRSSVPPASWFTQSLGATQPIPIAPSASASGNPTSLHPVEPLESDVLRQAVEVWLQNEQHVQDDNQSQQFLLHQILALESQKTEPTRRPLPPGRPLPPPPTVVAHLSRDPASHSSPVGSDPRLSTSSPSGTP